MQMEKKEIVFVGQLSPNRNCLNCNKKFYGKNKFCSKECQNNHHSKEMSGEKNIFFGKHFTKENSPSWKGGEVKKVCMVCGKAFYRKIFEVKVGHDKFCSSVCWGKWKSLNIIKENHLGSVSRLTATENVKLD